MKNKKILIVSQKKDKSDLLDLLKNKETKIIDFSIKKFSKIKNDFLPDIIIYELYSPEKEVKLAEDFNSFIKYKIPFIFAFDNSSFNFTKTEILTYGIIFKPYNRNHLELAFKNALKLFHERKKAFKAYARFRIMSDNIPDGLTIIENKKIVYMNNQICKITGYSKEELGDLTGFDLATPEEKNRIKNFYNKKTIKNNLPDSFAYWILTKNGHKKYILNRYFSESSDQKSRNRYIITTDLTQMKLNEEKIKELKDFNEDIIQNMGEGIILEDEKGIISFVNPATCKLLEYSKEELEGKHWTQIVTKDNQAKVAKEVKKRKKGISSRYELEFIKKNGDKIFVLISAKPKYQDGEFKGILSVFTNITQQKKTEETLREKEELFKHILNSSPIGIYRTTPEGKILMANQPLVEMLGYSSTEELTNRNLEQEGYHPEYPRSEFKKIIKEKGEISNLESVWVKKNGSKLHIRENAVAVKDKKGNIKFYDGTVENIAREKQRKLEQEKMREQMQQMQKLESLGVLAGGIAHDFNNLLMAILGNADLALKKISSTSPIIEHLKNIKSASRRASDLSIQLLAYSGKGKFVVELLDIEEIIKEMTHMLEVSISKKAILKYNFSKNLPLIKADTTQIRQIIMNLITNASEAIGDKSGIISISTGAMEADRNYLKQTFIDENLKQGLYVFIEIADTGCGMDKQTIEKIFDPFFTTKFTGRGLGMAAVLGIVRGHNGALKIYSEKGQGTTIKVLLPAVKKGSKREKHTKQKIHEHLNLGATILLVDDEETVRAVGKSMLNELGFDVITSNDGKEALKIYKKNYKKIDCVILDLTMPRMDGQETFRRLKQINKNVNVIMSSGYNQQEVTQRFVGKGLAGFIQKPYDLNILKEKIGKVINSKKKYG